MDVMCVVGMFYDLVVAVVHKIVCILGWMDGAIRFLMAASSSRREVGHGGAAGL